MIALRACLLAFAACYGSTQPPPAPPPPTAVKPLATVQPRQGLGSPIRRTTVIVDTGTALYMLERAPTTSPVVIPLGMPRITVESLRSQDGAGASGALVVMSASTPASRVGSAGDGLRGIGRCFVPIIEVYRHGSPNQLAQLGDGKCFVEGDEERVVLTIYVTAEHWWIGMSRVNEFQQIPRIDNADHKKLILELTQHRRSAFFVDRTDIQIVGDLDVSYGELVSAAQTAVLAGFTSLVFVSKERAAAIPQM